MKSLYPFLRLYRRLLFVFGRTIADTYHNEQLAEQIIAGDRRLLNLSNMKACPSATAAIESFRESNSIRRPKVLDFGGGGGRCGYFLNPSLFDRWVVLETTSMVKAAKSMLPLKKIVFVESADEASKISTFYEILHISSALQYTPSPKTILEQLLRFSPQIIIFEKLVLTDRNKSVLIDQYSLLADNIPIPTRNVKSWTLAAKYPLIALSREELLEVLGTNYRTLKFESDPPQSHLPFFRGLKQYTIVAERILT